MARQSKSPAAGVILPSRTNPVIEMVGVDALIGYENNARTHSEKQVAQIGVSISRFGFTNPILADEEGGIIAGHGRLAAALALGLTEVPVIRVAGLTEPEKRALVLADNQIALNAGWDQDLLRTELLALDAMGFDLDLLGFDDINLVTFMAGPSLADPDAELGVAEVPVSQPGDVWLLGEHRIICGSSTDPETVARLLGEEKPNVMVTDPPYGVNYDATWRGKAGHATMGKNRTGVVANDDRADWREAWALFPGHVAYVWHDGLQSPLVAESLTSCGFELRSQIIWNKTVMAMGRGDYHWKHEPCWYAVKGGGAWQGDRKQTTVWEIASPLHIMGGSKESKTDHPTQKPVECMRRPILNNSKPGDAIYEPFSGSGTTIIACEMEARRCFAVELNPLYVDMAVKRWEAFTGKVATHFVGGMSFAAYAEARATSVVISPPAEERA